jgi:hypothetical protein
MTTGASPGKMDSWLEELKLHYWHKLAINLSHYIHQITDNASAGGDIYIILYSEQFLRN